MAFTSRPRLRVVLVTVVLVAVVFFAGALLSRAQVAVAPQPVSPMVLAGPDVGFRVVARKGDTPVGQLVVRVNGEWRTVEFGNVPLPLSK